MRVLCYIENFWRAFEDVETTEKLLAIIGNVHAAWRASLVAHARARAGEAADHRGEHVAKAAIN